MSEETLKIAILEPSAIIRSGLATVLKRLPGFHVQTYELSSPEMLVGNMRLYKPDLLIINPVYWGIQDFQRLKDETNHRNFKTMAIITGMVDESVIARYDDVTGLYDTAEQLKQKFDKLFNEEESDEIPDETDTLSQREKEIISCVVKGLTNKEIATELFLSTHTVITHRRNIARKLGIHSAAGLTIYAIMNKLVDIKDVNPTEVTSI